MGGSPGRFTTAWLPRTVSLRWVMKAATAMPAKMQIAYV